MRNNVFVTNFLLIVKSASLNLPRKFRETETEPELVEGEFPRALNFIGLVQQPTELSIKKFSDEDVYKN